MQVPNSNKIGLVYMLEEDGEKQVHPIISSIFMEAATEAIQNMSDVSCVISGILKYSPLFFQIGTLPDFGKSERIGKLYGNIFLKKYPHLSCEKFSVQLDDLLSWPYWPNFIKIYSMSLQCVFMFRLPLVVQVDLLKPRMAYPIAASLHAPVQSPCSN